MLMMFAGLFAATLAGGYLIADFMSGDGQDQPDDDGAGDETPVTLTTEFFIEDVAPTSMLGSEDDDTLSGTAGPDNIAGLAGNDDVRGHEGDDLMDGGDGDDRLSGGDGLDSLAGGEGGDLLLGDADDDLLDGQQGNDSLEGGDGSDDLFGSAGDDRLDGGDGSDLLNGGEGSDTLHGGAGDDTLAGSEWEDALRDHLEAGEGDDVVTLWSDDVGAGGAGADLFTIAPISGGLAPTISDYNPAEDQIVVTYDPAEVASPDLAIAPSADIPGASVVLMNGTPVAVVLNAPRLTAEEIVAQPVAA